eukprot:3588993-Alexandrium_andersonii.AAC.1
MCRSGHLLKRSSSFCALPFQEVRQTANFRARRKFAEWRTSGRGELEPPGCCERAGVRKFAV